MAFEVRRATPDDAPAIAQVHVDSWRSAYVGMMPQDVLDGLSVEALTRRWNEILGRGPDAREVNLVAVPAAETAVLGFAAAGPTTDEDAEPATTAMLHAIYLDENAWGQGMGTALLEAAVEGSRRLGFGSMTLWVIEANERARRFYEARGWTADGVGKECFGMDVRVDVPTVRYRRSLA